jgi:hypothetical protein
MRILLIATNRHHQLMSRMDTRPLPIGLAYVAGYQDPTRHTVKILDLMFAEEDYLSEVEDAVREFQPELIGISIRNLSNHSYLNPSGSCPLPRQWSKGSERLVRLPRCAAGQRLASFPFSILPKECFA